MGHRPNTMLALATAALSVVVGCSTAAAAMGAASMTLPLTFTLDSVTVKGKELPMQVYASGAITASGTWHEKTLRGGIDHVTISFPKGNLYLTARENLHWRPNYKACMGKGLGGTTWRVTGGTGRYHGATGGGRYTDGGTLLGARDADGKCLAQQAAPPYVVVTADFVGHLTLPNG